MADWCLSYWRGRWPRPAARLRGRPSLAGRPRPAFLFGPARLPTCPLLALLFPPVRPCHRRPSAYSHVSSLLPPSPSLHSGPSPLPSLRLGHHCCPSRARLTPHVVWLLFHQTPRDSPPVLVRLAISVYASSGLHSPSAAICFALLCSVLLLPVLDQALLAHGYKGWHSRRGFRPRQQLLLAVF